MVHSQLTAGLPRAAAPWRQKKNATEQKRAKRKRKRPGGGWVRTAGRSVIGRRRRRGRGHGRYRQVEGGRRAVVVERRQGEGQRRRRRWWRPWRPVMERHDLAVRRRQRRRRRRHVSLATWACCLSQSFREKKGLSMARDDCYGRCCCWWWWCWCWCWWWRMRMATRRAAGEWPSAAAMLLRASVAAATSCCCCCCCNCRRFVL